MVCRAASMPSRRGVLPLPSVRFDLGPGSMAPCHSMNTSTRRPPPNASDAPTYPVSTEHESCSREHAAAVATVLVMHLGHVCTPGAAGIARRGAREVVKSASTIRLVSFFEWRASQGAQRLACRTAPTRYTRSLMCVRTVSFTFQLCWEVQSKFPPPAKQPEGTAGAATPPHRPQES